MQTCPRCAGTKKLQGFFPVYAADYDGPKPAAFEFDCTDCDENGEISDERVARAKFGAEIKRRRLAAGKGLREFAELMGFLPSAYCDYEHGRITYQQLLYRSNENGQDQRG